MKVSQSRKCVELYSRAVAKIIKCYDETVSHEDRHRKGRPRVTSAVEDTFIIRTAPQIAAQNASQSSSNRHISTSAVQRRLCESGLHGRIAAKKPLLKEETCLGQETRVMNIRLLEICPLV